MSSLTDAIIGKYPGAYDHLDPADIEKAVITQYPGAYDHMTEHIDELNKDSKPPSTLDNAINFLSHIYSKDPSKESNILPDIKQPETYTGGFLKSLYDQYVKPMGTIPGMAEAVGGLAAGGIHDVPSTPTLRPSQALQKTNPSALDVGAPAALPKPNLPPEFTAVGDEPAIARPQIDPEQKIYDLARNRFGMGQDLPARQGVMSEAGGLGSGGGPKSEDYLQARQFFRDQGKEIPRDIQSKATDIKYDDKSGLFHATDTKGKSIGAFDEEGNSLDPAILPNAPKPAPGQDFLTKAANTTGMFARNVLGVHVPGTAISIHGLNELRRDVLFGGSPIGAPKRAFEDLKMLVNPGKAQDLLNNIPPQKMSDMVNKGKVQMSIGDVDFPSLFKGSNLFTKGYNMLTNPKPLFNQVIPAMKVKTYDKYFQQMKDAGLSDNEAHQVSGNFVNNIFGGVTPEKLSADPTFRKLSRIAMLAPDWMTSNYRLGKGVASLFTNPLDPRKRAYANGMMNLAAAYTGANIMNYMSTGHFMWHNEPGKELSVAMGSTTRPDGKKATRYFDPFGTAVDFIKLPVALAHSAISGDPGASFNLIGQTVRDRLSPPMGVIGDNIFNEDYKGAPLRGKSKFGRHTIGYGEEAENIGTDILDHVMPSTATAPIDYAEGKISPEEAAAKFLSIPPVSYRRPAKGYREQDQ